MNIAILGFGTVGSGVYEIVKHAQTDFTKQLDVKHILIRKGKAASLPCMCDDIATILNDDSVDIVVETMGGIEPAHTYIMDALKAKKHVVTANKAVVAKYMKEFLDCAKENGVYFYFEASTGGGIPWIAGLDIALRIDRIHRIYGFFNGTSNFILDHMQRYHADFDEVLKEAQELGYAEADPSADIDGYDICNKLRISASIAYDFHVPDNFPVFGIRNIIKQDVQYFKSLGMAVRLVAKTARRDNAYSCVVEPVLFQDTDLEANTKDNFNLISLNGDSIGDLKFFGQGAGKLATANAIVQDIIDILEDKKHYELHFNTDMTYDSSICIRDYILRCSKECRHLLSNVSYETSTFTNYLHIKKIEVAKMHVIMQEILKVDPTAFMASIYDNREE